MMRAETAPEVREARRSPLAWAVWSAAAAFGAYFCMYAFRKPFTAATYSGGLVWGIGEKTALVTAQVLGYTLSKVIGIRVVAEMSPEKRAAAILVLIAMAEAALVLFAVAPSPLHVACLFLNGLPLGMVFGMVLGFLEGRRLTEALTAGLCASFILADGVTKSVGTWLLQNGVTERWMPALAGLVLRAPAPGLRLDARPDSAARRRRRREPERANADGSSRAGVPGPSLCGGTLRHRRRLPPDHDRPEHPGRLRPRALEGARDARPPRRRSPLRRCSWRWGCWSPTG